MNQQAQRQNVLESITVLLFLVLTGVLAAHAQNYSVVNLGWPAGAKGAGSEAHGINQNGAVVGTWYQANHPYSQYAFVYANGTNTDLGTISSSNGNSYDYAIANAMNGSNQIVGQGTTNSYSFYHAFLDTNRVMIDLDTTGQAWSGANAINQRGQIVGFFTIPSSYTHAFLYTNGAMLDLGTLSGGTYSSARGINDSGTIVGESSDVSGNIYAFIYSNNIMTGLGNLGGTYSSAAAINNSGTIVGESSLPDGELRAFVMTNGIMSGLGTFGGTNSSAQAINNGGVAVGYASSSNEVTHAFVYSGSTMLNLDTVRPSGCAFTNLAYAYGINDAGQICGGGLTTNGNYDAFLLTPPVLLLNCSSNLTVTAANWSGAVVSFTLTATGGCSQATVTSIPASGSTFPVGTTTVNVTASDLCGHTNTCNFTVTVKPPVYPPIALINSTNITVTATSSNGAVVSFASTATGGCSPPAISFVPASGSTFPIGTTTVTNAAYDSCGNSTNGTFTVTVRPLPTPLSFTTGLILTNHFAVTISGATGQVFVVQTSSNLLDWIPLFTNTLLGSPTNWTDPNAFTNNYRFYRTLTLPQ